MLPGFEVVAATWPGGTFNDAPTRLVLHTTEGDTIDGAIGAYRATGSWPHFTVDPKRQRRVQHYELDVSSRALLHRPGDPETNRAGTINIEVCGFATQTPAWPHEWLDWLREQVTEPIRRAKPFALRAPLFVAYPASYGFGATQRLSWADWAVFDGICGHEHVPGNDHGDPGALDVTRLLLAPTPPPKPPEDSVQFRYARLEEGPAVYLVNVATKPRPFVRFKDAEFWAGMDGHKVAQIGDDVLGADEEGETRKGIVIKKDDNRARTLFGFTG